MGSCDIVLGILVRSSYVVLYIISSYTHPAGTQILWRNVPFQGQAPHPRCVVYLSLRLSGVTLDLSCYRLATGHSGQATLETGHARSQRLFRVVTDLPLKLDLAAAASLTKIQLQRYTRYSIHTLNFGYLF
jgi:hypothetical protein